MRRQVVLNLDGMGAPVHPGLFRVANDVELVVRVLPNRSMDQGSITLWTNAPLLPRDKFFRTTFRRAAGRDDNPDCVWQVGGGRDAHTTFLPRSCTCGWRSVGWGHGGGGGW
jgi:hypothetical protein